MRASKRVAEKQIALTCQRRFQMSDALQSILIGHTHDVEYVELAVTRDKQIAQQGRGAHRRVWRGDFELQAATLLA